MTAPGGWILELSAPVAGLPAFETALGPLGGALSLGLPDEAATVPVSVYLNDPPAPARVTALLAAAAAAAGVAVPAFEIAPLPDIDWVAESQKALPPLRAGRFWVYGSHVSAAPPAASIPLRIDANAAFGTGRHESTRGCLIALSELARHRRFRRPLDLGCGSGVLAIAMTKLWAVPVLAADSDRVAVAVTRTNAAINHVAPRLQAVVSDGYRSRAVARGAPFDLIVANILAEPLSAMAGDLARHLAPGGTAVLSGLLAAQQQAVLARHRAAGLRLAGRLRFGDWVTLVLARGVCGGL